MRRLWVRVPWKAPKGSTHFFHKSGVGFGHFSKKEKMTLYGPVVQRLTYPAVSRKSEGSNPFGVANRDQLR